MSRQVTETGRKGWMATLAKAPPARLAALMPDLAPHALLRAPETGAVMVRGRTGGTGAPFNLGEMTVTRCAVRLGNGCEGHAYVMGRNGRHARLAAICDALLQQPVSSNAVSEKVIAPLEAKLRDRQVEASTKAAATKVDFFTMVRGDD